MCSGYIWVLLKLNLQYVFDPSMICLVSRVILMPSAFNIPDAIWQEYCCLLRRLNFTTKIQRMATKFEGDLSCGLDVDGVGCGGRVGLD